MFNTIPNTECRGLVTNIICKNLFKQSRITLLPSYFDANPSTLQEANAVKCIPIISKNIGGYENFPPEMICSSLTTKEWLEKIIFVLDNYDSLKDKDIIFPNKYKILDLLI